MFYFAYGLLTDQDYMYDLGAEFVDGASIDGYKLELLLYANVVPMIGSTIYGALWIINDKVLTTLDMVEGYPVLYTRVSLPTRVNGQTVNALCYTMTDKTRNNMLKDRRAMPGQYYVRGMYNGYRDAGVPTKGIEQAMQETIARINSLHKEKKQ